MAEASVVDSSAVLAVIYDEPGNAAVVDLLAGALMSTVNLAEVHTRLVRDGVPPGRAWNRLMSMGFTPCVFEPSQARAAAEMVAQTSPRGLSLGDRACLALALERKAKVYTTDRAWNGLSLGIDIEVIR